MRKTIELFKKWFSLKPVIDSEKKRPYFQEREIWMCHIGTNVGFEMDGKHSESLRPAIVFKKLSTETMLIIPLTGKEKSGSWYSKSVVKGRIGSYCMHQIRMIDAKRLKYVIEQITKRKFKILTHDFKKFLKL